MLIRSWKDIGISKEDFERLWNLPAGAFKKRIDILKKSKVRENFFPEVAMKVSLVKKRELYVTGNSEEDIRKKVYGSYTSFFADVGEQEQVLFERVR